MKNFKILFSIAVASALVGCSSMAVDEDEALEGNLPADFDVNEYMSIHPELVRLQRRDYISIYNKVLQREAKAANIEAEFNAAMAADSVAFESDTASMHKILVTYAGYTEEQWSLPLQPTVKDSIIYEPRIDTVAMGVKAKDNADGKFEKIFLCNEGENRAITYTESVIASVIGYADRDSSCTGKGADRVCIYICKGESKTYSAEEYEFNTKASSPKEHGMQTATYKDSVGVEQVTIPGVIPPSMLKAARAFNFYDSTDDLAKIESIKLDLFAISYQYSAFGQDHGWAYRRCKEGDNLGKLLFELDPATLTYVQTAPFPSEKLYCDDNGESRELLN